MTRNPLAFALTLLVFGAAPIPAADAPREGWIIVSKVSQGGAEEATVTEYVAADRARVSNGQREAIIEYATGQILVIDHFARASWPTSLEELRQLKELFRSGNERLVAHLADTPAAWAANRVGAVLLGDAALGGEVQPDTTGARTIGGQACQRLVYAAGSASVELWGTAAIDPRALDGRRALNAPGTVDAAVLDRIYDQLIRLKRYPLEWQGRLQQASLQASVTSLRRGALPENAFTVPEDYRHAQSPTKALLEALPRAPAYAPESPPEH